MLALGLVISFLIASSVTQAGDADVASKATSSPERASAADPANVEPHSTAGVNAATVRVAADAQPDPNEKVCKLERQLGSNKMARVCRTRAQIDAERASARSSLARGQGN